eukprot:CAMPEP_0118681362 /NCGR_PEP_ID=MMETSP0800-20121206/4894_1 /TAXON_ID=210618 ORGANISM="Striatella unipunctata, Strain CCMP2910" /NCGR_SAMPLE_ID=MMETSP0800 /ASSEMBLY_ACC=CAM_ASM_000638 /LENGTH=218 /DNA_ID=CAMNT_0006577645 /DNA_START=209 /DNA_END=865 /DNA_ORIENTATION=+
MSIPITLLGYGHKPLANYCYNGFLISLFTTWLDMAIGELVRMIYKSRSEDLAAYWKRQQRLQKRAGRKSKKQALRQQRELMAKIAERKAALERSKNGLVILNAKYLTNSNTMVDDASLSSLDVKIPLQFLVHDSKLRLPRQVPKQQLLGFCHLEVPHDSRSLWPNLRNFSWTSPPTKTILSVRYQWKDDVYEITFHNDEEIRLPHPAALRLGPSRSVI